MEDAVALIERWIATRTPTYVCITSVHDIIESLGYPRLRKIHNDAGLVTPDGMPLVWMSRWLGFDRTRRVYGPDLMRTLSALSVSRGYRHFYYGGDHGVADRLKQTLIRSHPGLQVVGTLTPPFRPLSPEEDDAVIAQINAAKPDIVWVGLSTPKQEFWMAAHVGRLDAPVLIGVGAAFDFLAGIRKRAPRWMRRSGA
jgi:N-acetylglucosaminyldiphosphoundecaprenol N-acetyl-beta-D-mannosaminyltransferase